MKPPYIFDIDGTLFDTHEKEYDKSTPIEHMIALVNMLHNEGHKIIIITARGTGSGIDYEKLTRNQLKKFGVQYDELIFGRFVTDKAISPEEFVNEM